MENRRNRRGSALIEAAFILPVISLVLCGSIDVVRAVHLSRITLAAARTATHAGLGADLSHADLSEIEAAARADAGMTQLQVKASLYCDCGSGETIQPCGQVWCPNRRATYLRVETSVPAHPLLRVSGIGSADQVRSEAMLRVE